MNVNVTPLRTPTRNSASNTVRLRLRPMTRLLWGVLSAGTCAPLMAQTVEGGTTTPPAPAAATPASAASGTGAAPTVQSVVVTARKRSEKAMDVPISVRAFSEKELQESGAFDLQDLKSEAGINFNQASGTLAGGRALGTLVFRGLQPDFGLPTDNSGSMFVDGIFISSGQASVNTSDVERVEVMKGPQNAFFGRSTFGGAINFVTKRPSDTFQGSVSTSASEKGSTDLTVSVEGPLAEQLVTGRLTFMNHKKAAEYTASDGGDLGAQSSTSLAGTLFFTPTESLWVRLRAQYQEDDDSTPALGYISGNDSCDGKTFKGKDSSGNTVYYTLAADYLCGHIPTMSEVGSSVIDANTALPSYDAVRQAFVNNSLGDRFLARAPRLDHMGMKREIQRVSAQTGYDFDDGSSWVFNVGYNNAASAMGLDMDRSKTENFAVMQAMLTEDLTVDTRWSSSPKKPLRTLVGASYYTGILQFSQVDWLGAYGSTTASIDTGNYINDNASVPAVYGSVEYDVLPQLTLAGDARYQSDTVKDTTIAGDHYSKTVRNFLPRVSLRFKPSDDVMTYVTYAEGVQPLSLNAGYLNATAAGKAYLRSQVPSASEYTPQPKLKSVEVGIKQALFNNRLSYALTLYNQLWLNRATNTLVFNPDSCAAGESGTDDCPLSASGSSLTYGSKARIWGIEFQADAALTQQWRAGVTADYKRTRWLEYRSSGSPASSGDAVEFSGNALAKIPTMTWTFNTSYSMPLPNGWMGFARGDVAYTGRAWDSDFNIVKSDPYYRVNTHLGAEKGPVSVELFVKNLFDDKHWDYAYRVSDLTLSPLTSYSNMGMVVQAPDRREVGVRVRYAFH